MCIMYINKTLSKNTYVYILLILEQLQWLRALIPMQLKIHG